MTLHGNLLRHLGKNYFALVSAIETMSKEETIDLVDIILRIIYYAKINKRNEKDITNNVNTFAMSTQQKQLI